MTEDQVVEYKQVWRDEYLKWICGFANAQGGVLEIGKDDSGEAVGLADVAKLMEDLPNKIRDILGIVPDVDRLTEDGKEFIRITVQPYPHPVSYKGQYHYRSGSTKQELKGSALDHLLLRKVGKHWDGVPLPGVAVKDLDARILAKFRKLAVSSQRLDAAVLDDSDEVLIERLRLNDGGYLKRAAALLFHPDPEAFFTGAYVKIGYFKSNSDLRFQDVISGDLFTQLDKTMDLLLTKYLQAAISYQGTQRLERFPIPESALREAVVNAIAHKDYASGVPIQISVYDDKIMIWNCGQLPENWTVDRLLGPHPSLPFNPDVANGFFRAGKIEAWGSGIERMCSACAASGAPEPIFRPETIGLWVELPYSRSQVNTGGVTKNAREEITKAGQVDHQEAQVEAQEAQVEAQEAQVEAQEAQARAQVELGAVEMAILRTCAQESASGKELLAATGYSSRTGHFKRCVQKLLDQDLIMMTIPESPRSRLQKYRLTTKGKALLATSAFGGQNS